MSISSVLLYLVYILLPVLALYLGYLLFTKAFKNMGFSSIEAFLIVFGSFLLGSGLLDHYVGFPFSNIPLFIYNDWHVGINTGGAVIPLALSLYLIIKHKLPFVKVIGGIVLVSVITYLVTYPDPNKGIVSAFPFWLLPVFFASLASIILVWNTRQRHAAPFAYTIGTIGVLIGADTFHLVQLLAISVETKRYAVIGGANVFDMVFLTGVLAVLLDGIFLFNERKKK